LHVCTCCVVGRVTRDSPSTLGRVMRDSPDGRHARGRGDVAGCTADCCCTACKTRGVRWGAGGAPSLVRAARRGAGVVADPPARIMHESARVTWSDQVRGEHDASVQECHSRIRLHTTCKADKQGQLSAGRERKAPCESGTPTPAVNALVPSARVGLSHA